MADAFSADDRRFMAGALALARRGLGRTWPNPAVGAVVVRDGVAVGRGWTQPGGRPHAETEALGRAGALARGATLYVTLEPCSHHGKTPPCAEAVIAAGIARVVAAVEDPDPKVRGAGFAKLRAADVAVATGLGADEAHAVNLGFFTRVARGRPMVTLKLATSLDGRIATHTGDSRWITGAPARARAHLLRAAHDAVMIGLGTALADDPELTCRLPGMEDRSPVRVVMDSDARLPVGGKLARSARQRPVWLIARQGASDQRADGLKTAGVDVLRVRAGSDNRPDPGEALAALAGLGITRVLVEGGGALAASMLAERLVDRLVWFRAPVVLGADGVPAVAELDVVKVADAHGFRRLSIDAIGADVMETYGRAE